MGRTKLEWGWHRIYASEVVASSAGIALNHESKTHVVLCNQLAQQCEAHVDLDAEVPPDAHARTCRMRPQQPFQCLPCEQAHAQLVTHANAVGVNRNKLLKRNKLLLRVHESVLRLQKSLLRVQKKA